MSGVIKSAGQSAGKQIPNSERKAKQEKGVGKKAAK